MKGYTIIELMIVVAIIAIIAAIAIPAFTGKRTANQPQSIGLDIAYVKDNRTGLCYAVDMAVGYRQYGGRTLGPVDCEKVKNFLQ